MDYGPRCEKCGMLPDLMGCDCPRPKYQTREFWDMKKSLEEILKASHNWILAKKKADENTHLMLSSARTSDEAADIMEELRKAEDDVGLVLAEHYPKWIKQ